MSDAVVMIFQNENMNALTSLPLTIIYENSMCLYVIIIYIYYIFIRFGSRTEFGPTTRHIIIIIARHGAFFQCAFRGEE